jgi:hypothetical protein
MHANNNDKEQRMSIGAVGGLTAAATAISALGKPETAEASGAAKPSTHAHHHKGAKGASHAPAVSSADAKLSAGRIDVQA